MSTWYYVGHSWPHTGRQFCQVWQVSNGYDVKIMSGAILSFWQSDLINFKSLPHATSLSELLTCYKLRPVTNIVSLTLWKNIYILGIKNICTYYDVRKQCGSNFQQTLVKRKMKGWNNIFLKENSRIACFKFLNKIRNTRENPKVSRMKNVLFSSKKNTAL